MVLFLGGSYGLLFTFLFTSLCDDFFKAIFDGRL